MNDDLPLEDKREPADQLEEYKRLSELFQFYLELALKAVTFALGIAGAVCAFVLRRDGSDPYLVAFGLFLPAALCFGMGLGFLCALPSSLQLNKALKSLKTSLKQRLAPHALNLTASLGGFGALLIVCGIFLAGLFFYLQCGSHS